MRDLKNSRSEARRRLPLEPFVPTHQRLPLEPIIKALPRFKDRIEGFQFWCPWCQKWHLHGTGEGPRISHCYNSNAPFFHSGYTIISMSKREMLQLIATLQMVVDATQ